MHKFHRLRKSKAILDLVREQQFSVNDLIYPVFITPGEGKKEPIEAALEELKKAHESKDLDQIDAAMEKINEAWKVASEEMYKAQQEAQANGSPGADASAQGEASDGDDVQDVDFEEVKED